MLRVQIVDTPFCSETGGIRGFQRLDLSVNRTAVIFGNKKADRTSNFNRNHRLARDFAAEGLPARNNPMSGYELVIDTNSAVACQDVCHFASPSSLSAI